MARGKTTKRKQSAPAGDRAQPAWRRYAVPGGVAALLVLHYALALLSVRHKSNTYDELAHLTRGYSYTLTDDFRLGPPHPPLAHYWAALPGRRMPVKPPKRDQAAWRTSDVWTIGRQFFYYRNIGNAAIIDTLLFRGRAMIALWSVACGLLVYVWSRRLFGIAGGLLSVALFAVSPTVLAHARLVTTDCAVTLFFLAGLTGVWWVLHTISVTSVLFGAAALSCLFLSKMSAPLIIVVGLVLLVMRLIDRQPLSVRWRGRGLTIGSRPKRLACWLGVMVVWVVLVWVSIWGAYGFRYAAMTGPDADRSRFYSPSRIPEDKTVWAYQLRGLDDLAPVIYFLRDHRLLPEAYVYSAAFAAQTARGRNAFLNGRMNILGFRGYFPYTFLVKTPLPLLALIGVAVVCIGAGLRSAVPGPLDAPAGGLPVRGVLWQGAPLWVFLAIYWMVSIRSHLNIGHRHILPTYPVLFVLCGAAAVLPRSGVRRLRWLTPGLLTLYSVASMSIFPNYLTYFNWIAGGPDHAYRHLVDSSLDWGQDLPGFATWLDHRRAANPREPIYLAYFGSGGDLAVSHFGIDCPTLPMRLNDDARGDFHYRPGCYAISATVLQQVYFNPGDYRWTPELETRYQRLRSRFDPFIESADTSETRNRFANRAFARAFHQFDKLRLGRLCAYLRRREADENINHTILIYRLDADALGAALDGDPPLDAARPG